MGAHFEALDEGVLLVPLDSRYTQVGLNLVSVQVCLGVNDDIRKKIFFSSFECGLFGCIIPTVLFIMCG